MHIYVHIPFCLKKCNYCDFASQGLDEFAGAAPIDEYFAALGTEIKSRMKDSERKIARTVYFGGGTPGVGGIDNLIKTLDLLMKLYRFAPDCEISFETNPKIFSVKDYRRMFEAGFNRISIGAQSFDDGVLKLLGRAHDAQEAKAALIMAREAGFNNISADFMIGVPYKKGGSAHKTVFFDMRLPELEHISVYQFSVCDNTVIASKINKGEIIQPGDEWMAEEYISVCGQLAGMGFTQYEISNFSAGPEFISKHNYSYWQKEDYAGFGAGAVSTASDIRRTNYRDITAYIDGVKGGAYFDIERLGPREQFLEKVMLALRTSRGLTKDLLPPGSFEIIQKDRRLNKLSEREFIDLSPAGLALGPKGFMVMNNIVLTVMDSLDSARIKCEEKQLAKESECVALD
jgi:oxygen-independent coproporphyrinogen-3 oxidase